MTKRISIAVFMTILVVLAGCSGGGGGGGGGSDEPASVSIIDPESIAAEATPGENVTVKAETSGGSVDQVNLSYTVYNRSDIAVVSDRIRMNKTEDGDYAATIPGQPAGYRVEYEVRAFFEDGTQKSDAESYTVQLIESLSSPEGTVNELRSTLAATLYTTKGVKSVTFDVTKEVEGSNITVQSQRTVTDIRSTSVAVGIRNSVFGAGASQVKISYDVTVAYGNGSETFTVTSDTRSYLYENTAKKVLYVPVTFRGGPNTEPQVRPRLTDKANKTARYYQLQSDGETTIRSDWLINSTADAYFTLSGSRTKYYDSSTGKYDRGAIMNDGEELIKKRTQTDPGEYDHIVFVTAEQNGDFIQGRIEYGGAGALDVIGPDTIVVSVQHPYSTFAHELGHAIYRWGDYYGGGDVSGEIGSFGLMGSSRLDTHAATLMPYHRLEQGWASKTTIPNVNESRPNATQRLEWMSDDGEVAKFDPTTGGLLRDGNGVYQYILIGAHDSSRNPVPPHGDTATQYKGSDQTGSGANVYVVTEPSLLPGSNPRIDRVQSPSGSNPNETVTLRPRLNDTISDPDLGFNITATSAPRGVEVEVNDTDPTDINGINLYTLIECENRDTTSSAECQRLTGAPRESTSKLVAARFVGESGTVGRYPNGTAVRTLTDGTYLEAGSVQKLYVPRGSDARLNVSLAELNEDADTSVLLKTQVVTRDSDGDRTASGLRTVNLSNASTYEPELARLNTSQRRVDAGSLRTAERNRSVIAVENNGIRDLENVTVTTNSSWITVNQTDVGTVAAASQVPVTVTTQVPGGTPVGNYTFAVTVRGNGTAGTQTVRIPVSVTVLPTARWNTTLSDTRVTFADTNETTITYTVTNDASSNVPLRDVRTTVDGNVTALAIDHPEQVSTLAPGASRTRSVTIRGPENGTEADIYTGNITVVPLQNYTRYFTYPVPVPSDYRTLNTSVNRATVRIDARGPATRAEATFHPERQVAMRKGSATERITVDAVDTNYDVPAKAIRVRTSIPAGWSFQNWSEVWVIKQGPTDTRSGSSGQRVKLDPDDYHLKQADGVIVLVIDDIQDTRFGQYMTDEYQLEAELKLQKDPQASTYGYNATVDVVTRSPVNIYRTSSQAAAIKVFYPTEPVPTTEPGYATRPAGPPSRVAVDHVRISSDGRGVNATLSAPQRFVVDRHGSQQVWYRYELRSAEKGAVKNLWIRPVTLRNATHDVTEHGYVTVDALVTRDVQGAVASALTNGKRTTIELPATAAVANRTEVRVANITYEMSNETAAVTLQTADGTPAVRLTDELNAVNAHSARGSRNVTVGRGILDGSPARPPTSASTDIRPIPESKTVDKLSGLTGRVFKSGLYSPQTHQV